MNIFNKINKLPPLVKTVLLIIADILAGNASVALTIFFRYDLDVTGEILTFWHSYLIYIPIYSVVLVAFFFLTRLYTSLWTHAGLTEFFGICMACVGNSLTHFCVSFLLLGLRLPFNCYILSCILMICETTFIRYFYRFVVHAVKAGERSKIKDADRVMLIGGGTAGDMLIREIEANVNDCRLSVVCIIDDDPNKKGRFIHGIRVVGGRECIAETAEKLNIKEIVFAIPSINIKDRAEILNICSKTGCKIRLLPMLYKLANGEVSIQSLKKVEIEDLLGREPIKTDIEKITEYIKGSTVLITGGGGSIGSELCRQVAAHSPKKLIIFDIYENSTYDIQNELRHAFPSLELETLIGSVRDANRIKQVMTRYTPDIVFHAAAHKHVPLMEESPNEAVKNNVFGTFNTVKAAHESGVKRFVMISTDKAVNPTNIMGATKRICEMIIQYFNDISKTEFVAVRFGNVLGSNGSVIPLFKKQIEQGGPVTVTHPEIIRYFMTIPEAVSLVLHAGTLANGGEIFVFDMGEPVKILDLAENLIRFSGLTPYKDIDIVFTGLRPGEKLYEELLMDEEGMTRTVNNKIYIGKPINFDRDRFLADLERLKDTMEDENADIAMVIKELVPTFLPDKKHEKLTV